MYAPFTIFMTFKSLKEEEEEGVEEEEEEERTENRKEKELCSTFSKQTLNEIIESYAPLYLSLHPIGN